MGEIGVFGVVFCLFSRLRKKEQQKTRATTTSSREEGKALLAEYSRQMHRRLPGLSQALLSVEDPRKRKHYGMDEILMVE